MIKPVDIKKMRIIFVVIYKSNKYCNYNYCYCSLFLRLQRLPILLLELKLSVLLRSCIIFFYFIRFHHLLPKPRKRPRVKIGKTFKNFVRCLSFISVTRSKKERQIIILFIFFFTFFSDLFVYLTLPKLFFRNYLHGL